MTDPTASAGKVSGLEPTENELQSTLAQRVHDSIEVRRNLLEAGLLDGVAAAIRVVIDAARRRSMIFFIGNGGSSADAGHLAAELLGRFRMDREPLAAMALADNTAAMTAIGNDYGYAEVFSRQLCGVAHPGDVLIGLSTSGNSPNVVRAFEVAPRLGVATVALTGASGGALLGLADHCLRIPSEDTARIQECHVLLGHTLCELVEDAVLPALVLT
jgi:D-sedoheptulose 7-phosphate isomerase